MNRKKIKIIILLLTFVILENIFGTLFSYHNIQKLTINDFLILNRKIEEGIGLAISSPFTNSIQVLEEAKKINRDIIESLSNYNTNYIDIKELYAQVHVKTNTRGIIKDVQRTIAKGIKYFIIEDIKESEYKMVYCLKLIEMMIYQIQVNKAIIESKLILPSNMENRLVQKENNNFIDKTETNTALNLGVNEGDIQDQNIPSKQKVLIESPTYSNVSEISNNINTQVSAIPKKQIGSSSLSKDKEKTNELSPDNVVLKKFKPFLKQKSEPSEDISSTPEISKLAQSSKQEKVMETLILKNSVEKLNTKKKEQPNRVRKKETLKEAQEQKEERKSQIVKKTLSAPSSVQEKQVLNLKKEPRVEKENNEKIVVQNKIDQKEDVATNIKSLLSSKNMQVKEKNSKKKDVVIDKDKNAHKENKQKIFSGLKQENKKFTFHSTTSSGKKIKYPYVNNFFIKKLNFFDMFVAHPVFYYLIFVFIVMLVFLLFTKLKFKK